MALIQADAGLCRVKHLGSPQLDSSVGTQSSLAQWWPASWPPLGKLRLVLSPAQNCASGPVFPKLPGFSQNNLCRVLEQPTAHVSLVSSSLTMSLPKERTLETFFFFQLQQNVCIYIVRFTMGGVCETILHNIRINFKTLLGDLGLIPGVGRAPGGEYGYPLQYSGLENSTD